MDGHAHEGEFIAAKDAAATEGGRVGSARINLSKER